MFRGWGYAIYRAETGKCGGFEIDGNVANLLHTSEGTRKTRAQVLIQIQV
jgi:hypothetical protein